MKINEHSLKIFEFNATKKYILQRLTSLILAVTTIGTMSSCVNPKIKEAQCTNNNSISNINDCNEYGNNYYESKVFYEQENHSNAESTDTNEEIIEIPKEPEVTNNEPSDEMYNSFVGMTVLIDDSTANQFKNYVKNIEIKYPYQELYNIDASLQKYNSINKTNSFTNDIIVDNKVDLEKLYFIVKKNNDTLSDKKKMPESNVKKICKIICEVINDYLEKNNSVDYALLSEKLVNLRIEQYSSFGYGYYNSENDTIGINSNAGSGNYNAEDLIRHEIYHLLQNGSSMVLKDPNVEWQFGFCYKFKDEPVNALNLSWFYEGSAEYLTMDYNNVQDSNIYADVIKTMQTIKVATVLNKNTGVNDFEQLSLSSNLNDLFNYFNCTDDKDKKETLKMMYANELITKLNSSSDSSAFNKLYRNNINYSSFDLELKTSVAETLTKQFYVNLVEYDGNEISDIFSLISIFENEISRQLWYKTNRDSLVNFFDVYNDIQGNYFQVLATKMGIDVSTIAEMYNIYNSKTTVDAKSIDFIDNQKKDFYNHILKTRLEDKRDSINSISIMSKGGK